MNSKFKKYRKQAQKFHSIDLDAASSMMIKSPEHNIEVTNKSIGSDEDGKTEIVNMKSPTKAYTQKKDSSE